MSKIWSAGAQEQVLEVDSEGVYLLASRGDEEDEGGEGEVNGPEYIRCCGTSQTNMALAWVQVIWRLLQICSRSGEREAVEVRVLENKPKICCVAGASFESIRPISKAWNRDGTTS